MKIKGRLSAFSIVLMINLLYMLYYYSRDSYISWIEYLGLPILLTLAWWFGKQYDIAKFYSEKDALTGIYNRRCVEAFVSKMESKTKQKKQDFTLLLLDVNDFKVINDLFGHKVGDQYIKNIAHQLEKSIRDKDIVARWGGDEFLIISPGVKRNESLVEMLEEIHKNLKSISPNELEIGVSIGTACYPSEGKSFDELIKIADKKMYHIKSLKKQNVYPQKQTAN
ncbi:GGDEF domain-containing protein [Bacillus sp. sid0103]|uniref:GGDEF domain-containing protein n=1 Tax=Bacillus sp. sid0103 TaxID=2856337 RepID=UPI001C469700|nr:GGDEF domain-containing protein [Bacillus sp. sid0103]MBV7504502.1 GGDEF domain-containing protein [Bacillus sp. sid0103]